MRGNWPLVPTMDVVVPHTRTMADLLELLELLDVIVADDPKTRGDLWRSQPWVPLPLPSQVRPAFYPALAPTDGQRRGQRSPASAWACPRRWRRPLSLGGRSVCCAPPNLPTAFNFSMPRATTRTRIRHMGSWKLDSGPRFRMAPYRLFPLWGRRSQPRSHRERVRPARRALAHTHKPPDRRRACGRKTDTKVNARPRNRICGRSPGARSRPLRDLSHPRVSLWQSRSRSGRWPLLDCQNSAAAGLALTPVVMDLSGRVRGWCDGY